MIRRDRLKALLLDLIQIDSISRREGELAMRRSSSLPTWTPWFLGRGSDW